MTRKRGAPDKAKAKPETAADAPQSRPAGDQEGAASTAQEGQIAPPAADAGLAVAFAVDPAALHAEPPGDLDTREPPSIPPELDARLNGRERRTVWHMVAGQTYAQALDSCGVDKRASIRDSSPPEHVRAALVAVLQSIASKAGLSREWIIRQTVGLYRRAVQAEEVYDRHGRPTGVFRFDGPTAAKCLNMLAEWHPEMGGKAKGIAPGDVAELLRAVADRRQTLEERARGRLVGASSAAERREVEERLQIAAAQRAVLSQSNQGPDSADSSITAEVSHASP